MLRKIAPKARNVIAQSNSLYSESVSWPIAEGAKYQESSGTHRLIRCLVGLLSSLLIASLLSGSAMGQKKYQRPPIKTPDEFRGAESPSPADPNSIGDLKWFEVFQDEALQKLVRTAMDQNYDLRLAVARINAARANVGLARSNQFPQFDAAADLTTTRTSANSGASTTGQAGQKRSFG